MTLSLKNIKPFTKAPADEQEFHMLDATSHYNDLCNLKSALKVNVVKEQVPDANGGLVNDVRVK